LRESFQNQRYAHEFEITVSHLLFSRECDGKMARSFVEGIAYTEYDISKIVARETKF